MSVAEAQARISSAEFAEWIAFNNLEPFGEERADLRAGIIASTVANVGSQGRKQFKPQDFMPTYGPQRKPRQSVEDMKAVLRAASKAGAARAAKAKRKARG